MQRNLLTWWPVVIDVLNKYRTCKQVALLLNTQSVYVKSFIFISIKEET